MADIGIFEDNAFTVPALTAAINEQPFVPGRLAELGLFEEEGVTTLTVQVEKDGETLALVPSGERGTSGLAVNGSKRILLPFNTVHLPERFAIKADEIQGIRAFGEQTELRPCRTSSTSVWRKPVASWTLRMSFIAWAR